MSDAEIVTVLRKFGGFVCHRCKNTGTYYERSFRDPSKEIEHKCEAHPYEPKWLESRDNLAPVLAKLSDGQWQQAEANLVSAQFAGGKGDERISRVRFVLTCQPRILAQSVAEVLREGGGAS